MEQNKIFNPSCTHKQIFNPLWGIQKLAAQSYISYISGSIPMFVDMSTPQGPQKETRGPRQGLERTDSSGRSRDRGTTHTTHSWGLFLHPARVPRDHPRTLRDRTWSCSRASVSSVHKNREGELLPDPEAEWHPPGTPALVMSDSLTTFRERAARCMWAHPIYTQCGYALGAELLDFSHKIWSPSKFWPVRTRAFSPIMM